MPTETASPDAISFAGRVALVTGAGKGLGRSYALALAARGARVVLNDRDLAAAEEVAGLIAAAGGEAVVDGSDVASEAGGRRMAQVPLKLYGRLDALINNAGIVRDRTLIKMEESDWRQVLAVHLDGAYFVTRPAFQAMRERGFGRIVFTVSSAGLYGNFGQCNYSAAKMGLAGFMNALKIEGAKYDVKVNAVSPTALTDMTRDLFPAELAAASDPAWVTPLVLLLCSDRCPGSGCIYRAGLGHYARVALLTAQGLALGDGAPPSPEEVLRSIAGISDMTDAVEISDTNASLKHALKAVGKAGEGLKRG